MSYYPPVLYTGGQGLGALSGFTMPTNPPTASSEVWAPPGVQYLEVDSAGNPRPEAYGITAALMVPGIGWTNEDEKAGKLQINQGRVFGPRTADSIIKAWTDSGMAVVYAASTLQAPDGFFMPIATSNLLSSWTGQLGVYLAKMPYNGPMTKAGWGPYLTPGAPGTVPAKPAPTPTPWTVIPGVGPAPQVVPPIVPGPVPTPYVPALPTPAAPGMSTYDSVIVGLLAVAAVTGGAVLLWSMAQPKGRAGRDRRAPAEPFRGEYPVMRV